MQWDEYSGRAFASRGLDIFFAVHAFLIIYYLLYVIDTKFGVDNIDILFVLLFIVFLHLVYIFRINLLIRMVDTRSISVNSRINLSCGNVHVRLLDF